MKSILNWFSGKVSSRTGTDNTEFASDTVDSSESIAVAAPLASESQALTQSSPQIFSQTPSLVAVPNVPIETMPDQTRSAGHIEITTEPALALSKMAEPEPEPAAPMPAALIEPREPGPEVKLLKRGPLLYAICPHCEASWSIKERMFDPRSGRACPFDKGLDCPACEKSVSLPADLQLKK